MRRGFKAEAERHAASLRAATNSSERRTMDLAALARHLRITVIPVDYLLDNGIESLRVLHREQPSAFSAVTLSPPGKRRVVAYNSIDLQGNHIPPKAALTDGRTRSNVAHEFAHIILGHDVRQVQKLGQYHFFTCNTEQETEATWLAGALLLPRRLLLEALRNNHTEDEIATENYVSTEMARFRLNATGVKMQVARGRNRPR